MGREIAGRGQFPHASGCDPIDIRSCQRFPLHGWKVGRLQLNALVTCLSTRLFWHVPRFDFVCFTLGHDAVY